MATQVKMPQLGETVTEGTLIRWLKSEGEGVEKDEMLLEISTDKVDTEIPSPVAGVLTRIVVAEGETVSVGAVLAEITEDRSSGSAPDEAQVERPNTGADPTVAEPPQDQSSAPGAQAGSGIPAASSAGVISPLVRRLAADHGVDLASVRGTGQGGRITKDDVVAHGKRQVSGADTGGRPQPAQASDREETVRPSHMRKAIAQHMVQSSLETARAWNAVEVDMSTVAKLRERARKAWHAKEGYSLTWTPFVARAATQALIKFPDVNSIWNDDGTITRKHYVNMGLAVALPDGLIVPVVKGAEGMSVVELAKKSRDLAERARAKKLLPDDVTQATFTITNPGPFGSILSVPIISRGQCAILAMDAVTKRPSVVTDTASGEDYIAVRQMVFISMSWDHRIIDGAVSAQFLGTVKQILEEGAFEAELTSYL